MSIGHEKGPGSFDVTAVLRGLGGKDALANSMSSNVKMMLKRPESEGGPCQSMISCVEMKIKIA